MTVLEPYEAYEAYRYGSGYGNYGFVKIRVGKFFKKPLKSVAKMMTQFTRKPLKAMKKYPVLAAPLVLGGIAAAKAAGLTSYLAPLKAKAVTTKWWLKAKLAPVTARVGAFVRHRIIGVGAAAAAGVAKKAKKAVKVVKRPIKKILKPKVKEKPVEKVAKQGILSTVWQEAKEVLRPGVQTAVEASLAARLGRTPYKPIDGTGTSTVPIPAERPVAAAPPAAPAEAGVIKAGMFSIPKNMLPIIAIGGIGLLALLLLAGRGGGGVPMPMPMFMPYPVGR